MRASKLISIGILLAWLTGCGTLSAVFSGNSSEKALINDGEVVTGGLFNRPVKLKTSESQAAALGDNFEGAIESVSKVEVKRLELEIVKAENKQQAVSCEINQTILASMRTGEAQQVYLDSQEACRRDAQYGDVISMLGAVIDSLSKSESDIAAIANYWGATVRSVAHEGTAKLQAVMNPLADTLKIKFGVDAVTNGQDRIASVGIAAAQNGGSTTVGDVSISTSQNLSADSNDGGSGVGGSGGAGGIAAGGEGGAGTGGTGSGEASATKDGDTINFTVGNNNSNALSEDDGRSLAGNTNAQQLDASANGATNLDSNIDQQPVQDENTGELNNDPQNGSDNSLF